MAAPGRTEPAALPARERALLDRYALATQARSRRGGDRSAREAGHSMEFLDYRPYQAGDELRAVDWRAYARSGRLYTRLYQAERAAELHVVLDTSPSMGLFGKDHYARACARLLAYLAGREARGQVHLLDGTRSQPAVGRSEVAMLWRFLDDAPDVDAEAGGPIATLPARVLSLPAHSGSAAVVVLSDLLDPAPLRPALAALRARRFDGVFVQLLAEAELEPEEATWELSDVESDERLEVGPEEVRAYRDALRAFVRRVRGEILGAGGRHVLLPVPREADPEARTGGEPVQASLTRSALEGLVRSGLLERR